MKRYKTKTRYQADQKREQYRQRKALEKEKDRQMTLIMRALVMDLYKHMSEVEDFRSRQGVYDLDILLTLIFIGFLMGENDPKNIAELLIDEEDKIRSWLKVNKKKLPSMPSYSTILRVLHGVDLFDVGVVIVEWIERNFYIENGKIHYAVDGKALRGATRKNRGHVHPKFILNAFRVENGSIYMQLEVGNKTNELGSMPELFSCMDLNNVTITIDAAGTYGSIMNIIVSNGGHAILPVKGNQSNLSELIEDFVEKTKAEHPEWILSYDDIDNGKRQHGREEYRHYILIFKGVDELLEKTSFKGLAHSVGMVTRTVTKIKRDDSGNIIPSEPVVETQIYISDYAESKLSPKDFAYFVRNHWRGCETQHYILDVEFAEDRSSLKGTGKVMASLFRKAVLSLVNNLKRISHSSRSCHAIRSTFRSTCGFRGSRVWDAIENFSGNPT